MIIGSKTSRQAWLAVQERFSGASRVNIMQLKTELQTMRKGCESIEKFLQRVKNARDQLISVGVNIPDEYLIIVILNGLPDEYSTIRTVIEGRETQITLRDLRSQLLAAERCIEGSFSLPNHMTSMAAHGDGARFGSRDDNSRNWNAKSDGKGKDGNYTSNGMNAKLIGNVGILLIHALKFMHVTSVEKHGHLASTCYQNSGYKPQQSQLSQPRSSSLGPSPEC